MLKLSDNPPITYPPGVSVGEISGTWWVAHTKARNEKALAHNLRSWEIPYFLPLVEKVHIIRGRRLRSLLPLFSGYLFFVGGDAERYKVMTTNRVAKVINVVDQARLVRELTQLERALAGKAQLDPYPFVREGRRCRVAAGPLRGLEGIVERRRGLTRLILTVEALGQAVSLETDAALLEPVD